jgi:hypothetical protein
MQLKSSFMYEKINLAWSDPATSYLNAAKK